MRHPTVISLAAASIACVMLSIALAPAPYTSQSLLVLGIGFAICSVVAMFKYRTRRNAVPPYDPYDLTELRLMVHEDEREAEIGENEGPYTSAMCRCCGEVFAAELAVCPKCGRSQYC